MTNHKNFKLAFCTCIFCLLFVNTQSQKNIKPNFEVTCIMKGTKGKKILLGNRPASGTDESFKIKYFDSCYSMNDSFQFAFHVKEPEWRSIEIEGKKGWQSFVATPEKIISIIGDNDSLYKASIIGSKEDSLYNALTIGMLFPSTKQCTSLHRIRLRTFIQI